jgi:NitT/TauT family transport system substrate-binding protein
LKFDYVLVKEHVMRKSAFTCLLLAVLLGCQKSPSQDAATTVAGPLQKVTFAYTFQPQSTLVHVAMAKGYFKDEGLDVQPLMRTFGKEALQAVLESRAEFGAVAETPVMFSVLKGDKIFVIANIDASNTNNGVVARKDAGISAPADLKGKRIAFTPGTTSDFFLDSFLTASGLARSLIQAVPLKPEEMEDAIITKKIDATSTWNYPLTRITNALGADGVRFYDREIYTETFNIAARQEFVQSNPEAVRRLLRALIKAEAFTVKDPAEAQAIMAAATKVDKDLIRSVWDNFQYNVVLDQRLIITLEDETRWAIKNHLTDQTVMPDYRSFIHSDSLRSVRPGAVKLGR